MITILLRRLQRYFLLIKLLVFVPSVVGIVYLVINTAPELANLLIVTFLLGLSFLILLSFFINSRTSLLLSIGVTFLLFLKAVDLISPINLTLFAVFIVLLAFYFKQNPPKREVDPNKIVHHSKKTLFPKGWPGLSKRKV